MSPLNPLYLSPCLVRAVGDIESHAVDAADHQREDSPARDKCMVLTPARCTGKYLCARRVISTCLRFSCPSSPLSRSVKLIAASPGLFPAPLCILAPADSVGGGGIPGGAGEPESSVEIWAYGC